MSPHIEAVLLIRSCSQSPQSFKYRQMDPDIKYKIWSSSSSLSSIFYHYFSYYHYNLQYHYTFTSIFPKRSRQGLKITINESETVLTKLCLLSVRGGEDEISNESLNDCLPYFGSLSLSRKGEDTLFVCPRSAQYQYIKSLFYYSHSENKCLW